MTDCSNVEVRERLPDLLHDALPAPARSAVLNHLAECATCADELELLRQARGALDRAPRIDVARIVAALPAPPRTAPPLVLTRGASPVPGAPIDGATGRREHARWRRFAVAAGLLLAAGVGGLTWRSTTGPDGGRVPASAAVSPSAAPVTAPGAAIATPSRLLAVNVVGLSEDELAGLMSGLDDLDAIPASEPAPAVPSVPAELPAGSD